MIAIVFPGQGSQAPGMGRELHGSSPIAQEVFRRISEATSTDLAELCFDTPEDVLRETQNAQIALFTVSSAAFAALDVALTVEQRARIHAVAGHSVGEYAALAAAGVVSLEEGACLVQERGRLMAQAGKSRPGTMMAVLGLSREILEQVCERVSGVVVVANDNCPGQLVISGEADAVGSAGELAKAEGAKRAVPLNVSGAFHSPLMDDAARRMRKALDAATWAHARVPVVSNVSAEAVTDDSHWPALLERQLKSPVRWTESIIHLRRDGISQFVECGWGEVLAGLIRRIDKDATVLRCSDSGSLAATVEALN